MVSFASQQQQVVSAGGSSLLVGLICVGFVVLTLLFLKYGWDYLVYSWNHRPAMQPQYYPPQQQQQQPGPMMYPNAPSVHQRPYY